jgi:hypothetical protein
MHARAAMVQARARQRPAWQLPRVQAQAQQPMEPALPR